MANVITCFQLWGRMNYWNNIFFTSFIGNKFLITFTENAKTRSISYIVGTEWMFCVPLTIFASCLALLRAPYQNHITLWIFYLPCILARTFFLQTLTKSSAGRIKQPSSAICLSIYVSITAPSASDGPFAWRDKKNDVHSYEKNIWEYKE